MAAKSEHKSDHDLLVEIASTTNDVKAALFGGDANPGLLHAFTVLQTEHEQRKSHGFPCEVKDALPAPPQKQRTWRRAVITAATLVASNLLTAFIFWLLFLYHSH